MKALTCALLGTLLVSASTARGVGVATANYNPASGNVLVTNLAGQLVIAIRAAESELLKANALEAGSNAIDKSNPGEIWYYQFAGYQGSLNAGNIIVPGTPLAHITGSLLLNFAGDQATLNVRAVPEPASAAIALSGLAAAVHAGRGRRNRRAIRNCN